MAAIRRLTRLGFRKLAARQVGHARGITRETMASLQLAMQQYNVARQVEGKCCRITLNGYSWFSCTCTSANIIYCITCTLGKKLYIGETGRRLGDRFRTFAT